MSSMVKLISSTTLLIVLYSCKTTKSDSSLAGSSILKNKQTPKQELKAETSDNGKGIAAQKNKLDETLDETVLYFDGIAKKKNEIEQLLKQYNAGDIKVREKIFAKLKNEYASFYDALGLLEGTTVYRDLFDSKDKSFVDPSTASEKVRKFGMMMVNSLRGEKCLKKSGNSELLCKRFSNQCRDWYGSKGHDSGIYKLTLSKSFEIGNRSYSSRDEFLTNEAELIPDSSQIKNTFLNFCYEMFEAGLLNLEPSTISDVSVDIGKIFDEFQNAIVKKDAEALLAYCADQSMASMIDNYSKVESKLKNRFDTKKIRKQMDVYHLGCGGIAEKFCSSIYFIRGEAALSYMTKSCQIRNVTAQDVDDDAQKFSYLGSTRAEILEHLQLKDQITICKGMKNNNFTWKYIPPESDECKSKERSRNRPTTGT